MSDVLNVSLWGVPVMRSEPLCSQISTCELVTERCVWTRDFVSKLQGSSVYSSAAHLRFGILRVHSRIPAVNGCWSAYDDSLVAKVLSMLPVPEWDAVALRFLGGRDKRPHDERMPTTGDRPLFLMTDDMDLALKVARRANFGQRILTVRTLQDALRPHNFSHTGHRDIDALLVDVIVAAHARVFHPAEGSTLSAHIQRLRQCGRR